MSRASGIRRSLSRVEVALHGVARAAGLRFTRPGGLLVVFWCVLDVRRASHELLVSDALDVVLRFPFQVPPHLRPIHWHIVLE